MGKNFKKNGHLIDEKTEANTGKADFQGHSASYKGHLRLEYMFIWVPWFTRKEEIVTD